MARLTAPALSFAASGQIGKSLVIRRSKGLNLVSQYVSPALSQSDQSIAARDLMSATRAAWLGLIAPPYDMSAWRRAATHFPRGYSAYHFFVKSQLPIFRAHIDYPVPLLDGLDENFAATFTLADRVTLEVSAFDAPITLFSGASPTSMSYQGSYNPDAGSLEVLLTDPTGADRFIQLSIDSSKLTGIYDMKPIAAVYPEEPAYAVPIGSVIPYAGAAAPTGFSLCDGSLLSRTAYRKLFETIGTTFGDGDGSTTFAIPDLTNKFIRQGAPDGSLYAASTGAPVVPFAADSANANHSHGDTGNADATHDHEGYSGNQSADHDHTTTTGTQSQGHYHTGSTYNNSVGHIHTASSGNNSANHTHSFTRWKYSTTAVHNHIYSNISAASEQAQTSDTFTTGANSANHTHAITVAGNSVNHTHAFQSAYNSHGHTHTGTSGNQSASHSHSVTVTNSSASHSHSTPAANAAHGHAISGGDVETAPEHVLLSMIIRST